jgi:hypothetical protein
MQNSYSLFQQFLYTVGLPLFQTYLTG